MTNMLAWINSHGVESLVIYYFIMAILSTMPPLPTNAGYLAQWAYGAIHAFSADVKGMAQTVQVIKNTPAPENPPESKTP